MSYSEARAFYHSLGVDTESVLTTIAQTPISLHCWQGDDVAGFQTEQGSSGSGCISTGNYKGRARNAAELRQDLDIASSLIPGAKRLNLHAIYAETETPVDRRELGVEHFRNWIDWAKQKGWGLDFNPTCFGNKWANSGFTLADRDIKVRQYWIDHCIASRKIAASIGEELNNPVVTNIWIPDGYKDMPFDRAGPRERLEASLDTILAADVSKEWNIDAVESKLFGIGVESYTVGSHEFYMAYAVKNQTCLCLDAGHFHPTESLADKISSILQFVPSILTHVSRGVRWDSDHVVILDDPTRAIFEEIVRCGALDRCHIGLDFFDASINRIAAWVIGTRSAQKALLLALLEPHEQLRNAEISGDYSTRLALLEAIKTFPWGEVWAEHCRRCDVPQETQWMQVVQGYEKKVLSKRSV